MKKIFTEIVLVYLITLFNKTIYKTYEINEPHSRTLQLNKNCTTFSILPLTYSVCEYPIKLPFQHLIYSQQISMNYHKIHTALSRQNVHHKTNGQNESF